ncbi:MAG: type II toxin-antitoxin system prevent-host-death family antitoxin [Oscillospiraceae bacterium]
MLQTFVRPSRDLRNNYAEIARLVKEHDQVIITNQGKGESVLIGIEDYAQYEEFLHRRYVAEELAKAKVQANDPTTQWSNHESVWGALREKYEL